MNETTLKERTIALVRRARHWERESVAALSPVQRDAPSSNEKWNAKDKLVHINLWKAEEAQNLRDTLNGTAPDLHEDEGHNDRTYERYRDTSWEEVERISDDSTDALIAAINTYSEEALAAPDANDWFNGRAPAEFVANGTVWHGLMHISEAYIERGDGTGVIALFEDVLPATLELTPTPRGAGLGKYNFACLFAQLGQTDKALDLLAEAFPLHPALKEYAPHDSDLANLYDLERFYDLVGKAAE